jgi:hypothetical protein
LSCNGLPGDDDAISAGLNPLVETVARPVTEKDRIANIMSNIRFMHREGKTSGHRSDFFS